MEPANGIPGKGPERPEPPERREPGRLPEPIFSEPPQEDRLVRILRRVPMYAFIVFLGFVAVDYVFPGVKIVVQNGGPGSMKNISLTVREQTQNLEPIPEGQEGAVRFRLYGDANLFVNYMDEQGKLLRVDAGEHRFSRMSGTLRLRVRNGKVEPEDGHE